MKDLPFRPQKFHPQIWRKRLLVFDVGSIHKPPDKNTRDSQIYYIIPEWQNISFHDTVWLIDNITIFNKYLFIDWFGQAHVYSNVIRQLILHPENNTMATSSPATSSINITSKHAYLCQLLCLYYLVNGTVPCLLIGCSGTHCVKSNVMTGRGLARARQGYSQRGCGSASQDSRKSKDR